jgi:N-acetylglucosamine malate deacetylase 1
MNNIKMTKKQSYLADTKLDVIFYGAHADDVEISAGGTVAALVRRGLSVGLVDLTHAEMGTRGTPEIRHDESIEAAGILGVHVRERLDFGDGNLRHGRDEELAVIRLLRHYRPALVFAPYPDDRHPDHTRAGKLVTEAAFYSGLARIETDGQKAHRPQTTIYYMQNYVLPPSFVVDVTAEMDTKMKSLTAYRSQFYNPDSDEPPTIIAKKTFTEMIAARARHFGAMIGVEYGEAFVTKQPPRLDDLIAAYRGREVS